MQPCVTKPVLHESVCSKRRGHTGFLPTSSRLSSPSLGCTPPPVEGNRKVWYERHVQLKKWVHIHILDVYITMSRTAMLTDLNLWPWGFANLSHQAHVFESLLMIYNTKGSNKHTQHTLRDLKPPKTRLTTRAPSWNTAVAFQNVPL